MLYYIIQYVYMLYYAIIIWLFLSVCGILLTQWMFFRGGEWGGNNISVVFGLSPVRLRKQLSKRICEIACTEQWTT